MIERGQELGFTLESSDTIGIGGDRRRQNLQRDVTLQPGIARAIHFAHSAFAQLRDNRIRPDALAG